MKLELNKNLTPGFTLVELLISIFLIGIFSLSVAQITAQVMKSLGNITQNAIDVQSAIRFSNLIKYDFAGSKEVYAHSLVPTAKADSTCSSYIIPSPGELPTQSWVQPDPLNLLPYVRGLFTIQLDDVPYDKNPTSALTTWINPKSISIGYEIRQSISNNEFQLWRLVCSNGAIGQTQKLLNLGKGSSILTSNNTCYYLVGSPSFNCDSPTAATTNWYTFTLPYLGKSQILTKFNTAQEFLILKSRIDK